MPLLVHIRTEGTSTALQRVISKYHISNCYSVLSHVSEDFVYRADKSRSDNCIVTLQQPCRADLTVPCCAEYET